MCNVVLISNFKYETSNKYFMKYWKCRPIEIYISNVVLRSRVDLDFPGINTLKVPDLSLEWLYGTLHKQFRDFVENGEMDPIVC